MIELQWMVLLAAFILDFLLGDPKILPHPVIYMGNAIRFFEGRFRRWIKSPLVSGGVFACVLIVSAWGIGFFIIKVSLAIHPLLGTLVQIILLFFCFSAKSLEKAALLVFHALEEKSIDAARKAVSMIVGRQTQALDKTGITRASVETVAENFVDGFLSPLFFAMIGGVPWALAYKMINTLDSMVGYKNDTYHHFGRAAARIDDAANFIPARLSVLIISLGAALLSPRKGRLALKTGVFQGSLHKSPNAGYPEAAFSGALEIRLGGPSWYHGTLVEKPFIGKEFKDPEKGKIKLACDLMMFSSFLATLIACGVLFAF